MLVNFRGLLFNLTRRNKVQLMLPITRLERWVLYAQGYFQYKVVTINGAQPLSVFEIQNLLPERSVIISMYDALTDETLGVGYMQRGEHGQSLVLELSYYGQSL